mmetsp:Transcript_25341/g.30684  ORF Transcript_25341/g.30684 Transcript_25341/m.30684 type:complete len:371 (+) Transcript_25341:461-1573(+)
MLTHKTNRHNDQILHTLLPETRQHVVRIRPQPLDRPHPTLITQMHRGILRELRCNLRHARLDLFFVGIPRRDVRLWHAVGAKQHVPLSAPALQFLLREGIEFLRYQTRHAAHVPRPIVPRRYDGVYHRRGGGGVLRELLRQYAERRPARGNTKLGIERDNDEGFNAVAFNSLQGFFREWPPVAHGDVRFRVDPVLGAQAFFQEVGLSVGVFEDGGSSSYRLVGFARFWRAAFGDAEGDEVLERGEWGGEADDVGVGKKVVEEAFDVVARFGTAQVEQKYPYFRVGCLGYGGYFHGRDAVQITLENRCRRQFTGERWRQTLRHVRPGMKRETAGTGHDAMKKYYPIQKLITFAIFRAHRHHCALTTPHSMD